MPLLLLPEFDSGIEPNSDPIESGRESNSGSESNSDPTESRRESNLDQIDSGSESNPDPTDSLPESNWDQADSVSESNSDPTRLSQVGGQTQEASQTRIRLIREGSQTGTKLTRPCLERTEP